VHLWVCTLTLNTALTGLFTNCMRKSLWAANIYSVNQKILHLHLETGNLCFVLIRNPNSNTLFFTTCFNIILFSTYLVFWGFRTKIFHTFFHRSHECYTDLGHLTFTYLFQYAVNSSIMFLRSKYFRQPLVLNLCELY